MNVELLCSRTVPAFLEYCIRYEKVHDESFLSSAELNKFRVEENITFILKETKKENRIKGVFSLMPERNNRVRIFHAENGNSGDYMMLHREMLRELEKRGGTQNFNLFITEPENESTINIMTALGLVFLRNIYVLERELSTIEESSLPDGYTLTAMKFPEDAEDWADVRNRSMKNLLGYQYYGSDFFLKMNKDDEYLEDCTLILRDGSWAVGIIKIEKDVQKSKTFGFIAPIAILPDYQGKGLGRSILRSTISILNEKYKWPVSLCVNAENEDALRLYLQEGFRKTEIVREMGYSDCD